MIQTLNSFVYNYCVENEYTSQPGISLSEIGTSIQSVGFPRQIGKLSRLLERRADLFEVYEHVVQGIFVYAHVTPRVIYQPRPEEIHAMNARHVPAAPSETLSRLSHARCRLVTCTFLLLRLIF